MGESLPKGKVAIASLFLVYATVVGFSEGLRILRGGTLDVDSGNYWQTLAFVHLVNHALRRPLQQRLTQAQIRAYGMAGIGAGLVGIIGAAYALCTLLQ